MAQVNVQHVFRLFDFCFCDLEWTFQWYTVTFSQLEHDFVNYCSHIHLKCIQRNMILHQCLLLLLRSAMTSIVDSEPQFKLRLQQTNVPEALQRALASSGISTIAGLAYAYGQPGQPIPNDDFAAWVRGLLPSVTIGGISALKRLLFESQTQLMAMIKDQILNPESTEKRKVPPAERDSRLADLRARIPGQLVEGHSEPAHSLLDAATQMYESNCLKMIPIEKCFSRLTELMSSQKSQSRLLEIESSKVVIKDREDLESSVQSSYQLLEALKRRGLAFDFAGIMTFQNHERFVHTLFAHMNRDPPPGYSRVSVSQLIAADKACWAKIIERGIKPRPDALGALPLNTEMMKALESYEVAFALLPLPTKGSNPVKSQQSHGGAEKPKQSHGGSSSNKGKGKQGHGTRSVPYSKGKGKRFEPRIPAEIRERGGTASNPQGEPICFDFAFKKCKSSVPDGARCQKGLHICCICYNPHSMIDHKN